MAIGFIFTEHLICRDTWNFFNLVAITLHCAIYALTLNLHSVNYVVLIWLTNKKIIKKKY